MEQFLIPCCSGMKANSGGTELTQALNTVMRVFTIGLGNGVSTATCDGIARVGRGVSTYITNPDEILGKCQRLVSAARMVPITDIKISWEDPPTGKEPDPECEDPEDEPIDFTKKGFVFPTDVGPRTRSRQAPQTIPNFFPATRLHAYAIVPKETAMCEESLRITGRVNGRPIMFSVKLCQMFHSVGTRFIHTSAAKAFLNELEDEASKGLTPALKEDIVYYGTTFGLNEQPRQLPRRRQRAGCPCSRWA
jgi:hypothetical protein